MKGIYTTKQELYRYVENLRNTLKIDESDYPLNIISLLNDHDNVMIEYNNFKTKGLCGVSFVGNKVDTIILNSNRTDEEQNFDCCHEVLHLTKHRNINVACFNRFDKVKNLQNSFLEWQANEGAAELLVPYKLLLPIIKQYGNNLKHWSTICLLKGLLACTFEVSDCVIEYRLESLKYEIDQYLTGASINDIKVLSNHQQKLQHIQVESLNDIEKKLFKKNFADMKTYYNL